ncbi:MAG: hypothetical protein GKS05_13030 [Nitrospirales bacterium]|nr:hypothetical protein [Nitrospirales bacterium]NKB82778.1 hypothetical protein [Nitrospirales bacterium]
MNPILFAGILLIIVPFQATLANSLSVWGIRPDLCLVITCVVGFGFGQWDGVKVGFAVGFLQDLFSGGELWANLITKTGIGFLSGVTAEHLTNTNSHAIFLPVLVFSIFSGSVYLVSSTPHLEIEDVLYGLQTVFLPQALFDAILAMGLHHILIRWFPHE